MKNLTSFTCWHAYGMISQSDKYFVLEEGRDYEAAKKSYTIALKYDKENVQILRDLGVVQMQLRDYEAACTTNRELVVNKPLPLHWLSFAAAAYMVPASITN
jgi:hypothetical protein